MRMGDATPSLDEIIGTYRKELAQYVHGAFQTGSDGAERIAGFSELRSQPTSETPSSHMGAQDHAYPLSPNLALAGPVDEAHAALIAAFANQDYRDALAAERHRSEARIDELTGINNRRSIDRLLKDATESSLPGLAVIYDLDGFKKVNDTQGHETGDQLLRDVAATLREYVRSHDSVDYVGTPFNGDVGRTGGDEFLVILRDVDAQIGAARAEQINERLNEVLAPYGAGSSFGYAVIEPGAEPERIKHTADAWMYTNKHAKGTNR